MQSVPTFNEAFQPFYLSSLNSTRQSVVEFLTDKLEKSRITACRPYYRCNSYLCPICLQRGAYKQGRRICEAATLVPEHRRKFATLRGRGIPVEGLRGAAQAVSRAARSTLKRLLIADYALRLEIHQEECAGSDFLPHAHVIVDTPASGRRYISQSDWQAEWMAALPEWLHPIHGGVNVETVRNLSAASSYLSKSPFVKFASHSDPAIARIVNSLIATKGLQKINLRGALAV